MSWKKYFKPVNSVLPASMGSSNSSGNNFSAINRYNSWLPEVYEGPPDRLQRYGLYETMDFDHEIHAALDTISDFSTENDMVTKLPFVVNYEESMTNHEMQIIQKTLRQWCILNEFNKRIWGMFRSTLQYGDQFFIRDPETYKLYWCDPNKVMKVIVNESRGKKIETYYIRDLDLNLQEGVATNQHTGSIKNRPQSMIFTPMGAGNASTISTPVTGTGDGKFGQAGEWPVAAEHVVHLSLSDGMTSAWPFGTSILECVYKVYKQKELLEDAILIYRIHRAPERRVFFIDTGTMPPNKAHQYLERVKYEVQQKRVPNRNGGGASVTDAAYNPMAMLEDYFFAVTSEGRGSKVETLPGGENLGCFAMDTKIALLDGRHLTISEIESELASGKCLWTYSCHPITGEVLPGKIDWAGITKKNAEVVKVTLDNGEYFICTPDHKFPIKGVGFKEISELTVGQSMIGFYTENKNISAHKKLDYTTIYNHATEKWEYVHRIVANSMKGTLCQEYVYDDKFIDAVKDVRHHVDFNRYNNNPENLVWMNYHDHKLMHQKLGFSKESQELGTKAARAKLQSLKDTNYDEYRKIINKQILARKVTNANKTEQEKKIERINISNSLKKYFDNLSSAEKEIRAQTSINNFKLGSEKFIKLLETDDDFRQAFSDLVKVGQNQSKIDNPEKWESRSKAITKANLERWKLDGYYNTVFDSQKIKFNAEMFEILTSTFNAGFTDLSTLAEQVTKNVIFMDIFKSLNTKVHTNADLSKFTIHNVKMLLKSVGMSWDKFKAVNTKIVVTPELNVLVDVAKETSSQAEFLLMLSTRINEISIKTCTRHNVMKLLNEHGINDFSTLRGLAENVNHRIVAIEKLDETMDVGTLTIDLKEEHHDYHTYALSVGVFAKNSIDDLRYFNNKMLRALGVPSSYLPTGPDDGTASFNDGRVGTAFIQEFRFSKVCERYQNQVIKALDKEFKLYLKYKGIVVDNASFNIRFTEPQSFSEYRRLELDAAKINVFASMSEVPFISKRFALKRYLGLTEDEIRENEKMWIEENADGVGETETSTDLGSVGITSSGIDNMAPEGGFDDADDLDGDLDMGDMGGDDIGGDDMGIDDTDVDDFGKE